MSARDEVLSRVASALGPGPRVIPEIARGYRRDGPLPAGSVAIIDLFQRRLLDYKAVVRRLPSTDVAVELARVLTEHGLRGPVVLPTGLDPQWAEGTAAIVDDGSLTWSELDSCAAVLTGCAIAVAETGTIVLDSSPDQGRRAITLIPDLHVCVVRADQVVETVPEALEQLDRSRPLTLISGGSATSDIELQRVEGVHGPRTLVVLIVEANDPADRSGS